MDGDFLSVSAPAKINLYLKVTGRREDGYHFLTTLMQKLNLVDTLIIKKGKPGIRLSCPGSNLPTDKENIIYRGARLFFESLSDRISVEKYGVDIILHKKIPEAAGLGGGSSDAAATLKGLNQLYKTNCTIEELLALAVDLGADVPQFIVDWPNVLATGIGDELQQAVPLRGFRVLLVNPGISVSTKWVYENFALTVGENLNNLRNSQKESDRLVGKNSAFIVKPIQPDELYNDLEKVTARKYSIINTLKKNMIAGGATAALMSGSGPTVFGLFAEKDEHRASTLYETLKKEYENTFLVNPL